MVCVGWMRDRLSGAIGTLGVVATGMFAPVGLVLLGTRTLLLGRSPERTSRLRVYIGLAVALWMMASVGSVVRGNLGEVAKLAGETLLIFVSAFALRAPRRIASVGMLISLVVLVGSLLVETTVATHSWVPKGYRVTLSSVLKRISRPIRVGPVGDPLYRSWHVKPGGGSLELHAQVRLLEGAPGWDWNSASQQASLSPVRAGRSKWTQFVPQGPNPYIFRGMNTGQPIAGHTFRASIVLRAISQPAPCGRFYIADRGASQRTSRVVCPKPVWTTYWLDWTAPPDAQSPTVDIILNGFRDETLDIRDASLSERKGDRWQPLRPLSPIGVQIALSWGEGAPWGPPQSRIRTVQVVPSADWQTVSLSVPAPSLSSAGKVYATLKVERGVSVSVRRTRLRQVGAGIAQPVPTQVVRKSRRDLWFGQYNLAADAFLADGLVAMVAADSPALAVAGGLLALIGLMATASRAAFWSGVIAFAVLLWMATERRVRWGIVALAVATGTAILLRAPTELGRLRISSLVGTVDPVSRWDIWRTAWRAFVSHPWLGLGAGASQFADYFHAHAPSNRGAIVTHAHNLWLQFAASYGILGAVAVTVATGLLIALAWRRGRWKGIVFVAPILFVQVFDYTILFSAVLLPMILGLNVLAPRSDSYCSGPTT